MLTDHLSLKLSANPLSVSDCYQFALDPTCGAVNIFVGTVRDHNDHNINDRNIDEKVTHLQFESYKEMAIKEMEKIAKEAFAKWPCKKIAIHHRLGRTDIEEATVVIAVSAPHRPEGFQACAFIIDQLKKSVPIWKKEYCQSGAAWITATP